MKDKFSIATMLSVHYHELHDMFLFLICPPTHFLRVDCVQVMEE